MRRSLRDKDVVAWPTPIIEGVGGGSVGGAYCEATPTTMLVAADVDAWFVVQNNPVGVMV